MSILYNWNGFEVEIFMIFPYSWVFGWKIRHHCVSFVYSKTEVVEKCNFDIIALNRWKNYDWLKKTFR